MTTGAFKSEKTNNNPAKSRAIFAATLVGIIIPSLLALLTVFIFLLWRGELPNPIATHWGPSGAADGFMPFTGVLISFPLFIAGIPVFITGAVLASSRGRWAGTQRFVIAIALATSVLVTVIAITSVAMQRGLADAADVASVDQALFAAFAASVVAGLLGFFLQPRYQDAQAEMQDLYKDATQEETPNEWTGKVSMARAGIIVIWLGVALVVGATLLVIMVPESQGDPVAIWVTITMFVLAAVIAVLALTMTSFFVTADETGLEVRSVAGWPKVKIDLDDIKSINVTDVSPMGEFGGWGYRIGFDNRSGFIMRTGEALVVERFSKKRAFVVTVDGATDAARVILRHTKG